VTTVHNTQKGTWTGYNFSTYDELVCKTVLHFRNFFLYRVYRYEHKEEKKLLNQPSYTFSTWRRKINGATNDLNISSVTLILRMSSWTETYVHEIFLAWFPCPIQNKCVVSSCVSVPVIGFNITVIKLVN
jgi:hypothetical protein